MSFRSSVWARALVVGALAFAAPSLVPSVAHAASAQDRAAADALFDSGVKLMEAGNYDKACPKFQKSFDLDPGVGTLLNLGRCYELAGKLASAWSTYRDASAMARQEGQEAREEHARNEAKNLEPKLVRIKIELSEGMEDLPGFKLTQDGVALVADAVVGEAIPVDPGKHQVIADAEGHEAKTVEIETTEEGKTYTVLVPPLDPVAAEEAVVAPVAEPAAEKPQDEGAAQQSPEPVSEPPKEKGRSLAGPIILGSVGVVAVGVGTAFAFLAKAHDNDARAICDDDDDLASCHEDDVDDWETSLGKAKTSATIAYIGWGVGGAAITGAVIWAVAGGPKKEKVGKAKFTPIVGQDFWGFSARGTF